MDHDPVNHPRHYAAHPRFTCECIELTRLMSFDAGNALKYLWRFEQKNGTEDLKKSGWYLRDLMENPDLTIWLNLGARDQGQRIFAEHVAPYLDTDSDVDNVIKALCEKESVLLTRLFS